MASRSTEWRRKNSERKKAYEKEYYKLNRSKIRARQKLNWTPSKTRKYRYGITDEQFASMLIKQSNCCAICRTPKEESPRKLLVIDHDHKTGAIRGLLCDSCNRGLGYFRDDPKILTEAISYLSRKKMVQEQVALQPERVVPVAVSAVALIESGLENALNG